MFSGISLQFMCRETYQFRKFSFTELVLFHYKSFLDISHAISFRFLRPILSIALCR